MHWPRRCVRELAAAAAVLILCGVAAGCSAAVDPVAIADAQTAMRVKTALVNDPDLGGRAIEVQVTRGVATLSGRVQTASEAERAAELSRAVPGVNGVRSSLQIGVEAPAPADAPESNGASVDDLPDLQANPTLFALGGAIGWSGPRDGTLLSRVTVGPLFRLGSGSGLGLAVGFNWFKADLQSISAHPQVLSRISVKPVMAGFSYTLIRGRVALAPSVVGGVAFNSLTVTETGTAAGVPVEVDNSLVWRPAVSAWFDVSRRIALNVSAGYVMTGLRITVLEGGRLVKHDSRGDTTTVNAGVAYKLF